jgi:hypothetical protein
MNNGYEFEDEVRDQVRKIVQRNKRNIDGGKFEILLQSLFDETMDGKTYKGRPELITDEMVTRIIDRMMGPQK